MASTGRFAAIVRSAEQWLGYAWLRHLSMRHWEDPDVVRWFAFVRDCRVWDDRRYAVTTRRGLVRSLPRLLLGQVAVGPGGRFINHSPGLH